jgi:hypothetical protein
VHLLGFAIGIYYAARTYERQRKEYFFCHCLLISSTKNLVCYILIALTILANGIESYECQNPQTSMFRLTDRCELCVLTQTLLSSALKTNKLIMSQHTSTDCGSYCNKLLNIIMACIELCL